VKRWKDQIAPGAGHDDGVDRLTLGIGGAGSDDLEVDRLRLPAARCGSPWP
jgi:hypothetical protein